MRRLRPHGCYSSSCKSLFKRFGHSELLEFLESSYQLLLDRRKSAVEFGVPANITPEKQAVCSCELIRQSLLHRAERLMASSGTLLLERNVYGLALLVRGHYEATALLGYFCNRLESLADGNIKFDDFKWNVSDALMGAKHETFSEARPPLNVLTCGTNISIRTYLKRKRIYFKTAMIGSRNSHIPIFYRTSLPSRWTNRTTALFCVTETSFKKVISSC
jgi:hypothetical protein